MQLKKKKPKKKKKNQKTPNNSIKKKDRRSKQTFLQRRHTDGQKTDENVLNIANY